MTIARRGSSRYWILIFWGVKGAKNRQPSDRDLDSRLHYIVRIRRASEIATIDFTIKGSWAKMEFGRAHVAMWQSALALPFNNLAHSLDPAGTSTHDIRAMF
jgi:hypothetical protein